MLVVADSSPLIALCRIGRLELLHELFGQLMLPEARRRGVLADPADVGEELRNLAGFWIAEELMDLLRQAK